jgi:hypothetical protein
VSLLTHVTEEYQNFLLRELSRVIKPNSYLMLTTHSECALNRAINEENMFNLLGIDSELFNSSVSRFNKGEYVFISQQNHLASDDYQYGISFIPESYIYSHWAKWFDVVGIHKGAIHNWQDIVFLKS